MAASKSSGEKPKAGFLQNLVSGGIAGLVESSCCHPLDTIKTRMQLRSKGGSSAGPFGTAYKIVTNEGFLALYKGLSAVVTGIVPKMAVRFTSFEKYKDIMRGNSNEQLSKGAIFVAGLGSGVTEALVIVTPADVCKIRMQAQYHSMMDPEQLKTRKYKNVFQTAVLIVREEGVGALYKGVVPTVLRQGCNQAANFTFYQIFKEQWEKKSGQELQPWQHSLLGGTSGAIGPTLNNPLDVVKTRLQKQSFIDGAPKYTGLGQGIALIAKEEGVRALWKGLSPRLMRIVPGQAITFMTYEFVSKRIKI